MPHGGAHPPSSYEMASPWSTICRSHREMKNVSQVTATANAVTI